jgi:hypothetical protein
MQRLKDDSTIQIRLGGLLWKFGHAGDEEKGLNLIFHAAFAGNEGAWSMIYRMGGTDERIYEKFLLAGLANAKISDIDPFDEYRFG